MAGMPMRGSTYYDSLGDLLEREELYGVCQDCAAVLDKQGRSGPCGPEWEFEGCFCPLTDSDIWVMIEHYARVHEAKR